MELNLNDNSNKEIKVAQKRLDHTLIPLGCLAVTLISMFNYLKNPIEDSSVSMLTLELTTYGICVLAVVLVINLVNKLFYPSKLRIKPDGVVLLMWFISIHINNCTVMIEDNIPDRLVDSFKNQFRTKNPKVFTIKNESKSLSVIVDEKDLQDINKS